MKKQNVKYLVLILIPIILFLSSKFLSTKDSSMSDDAISIRDSIIGCEFEDLLRDEEISQDTISQEDFVPENISETQAVFPGGMDALMKYISENLVYPKEAYENEIGGRVILTFVVTKTGSIKDVIVVKSVDPLLDQVAIDVVAKMPKWIPGQQKGKNVAIKYNIPIVFKLPETIDEEDIDSKNN